MFLFQEVIKFGRGCKGVLFKGCGCPVDTSEPFGSEAPTEPTGETGLSFEKYTLATPSKLYHFPKKEHCKVADVPAFAMLQP